MSRINLFYFTILIGLSLMLFQNCGKGFESSNSNTSLSFCKVQGVKSSPFISSKVAIKRSFFSSQQKLTANQEKTNYSLIVNSRCLNDLEEPVKFFDQNVVVAKKFNDFKKVATNIELPSGISIEDVEKEVEKSQCILAVAENQKVAVSELQAESVNDPEASKQSHLQYLNHGVAKNLQGSITEKVVVAFVDSGIDVSHSEIQSRLWDDGNGNPGINIVSDNANVDDFDGHGTHVAGIVAAVENNAQGVAGLTGSYLEVMVVKVLERGAGSSQDVANGIRYAVSEGADIINLSIESPGQNPQIEDAIREAVAAGVFVTAAAGNQAQEITSTNLYAPAYLGPQLNGVMSVGSIDVASSSLSFFSNFSSSFIEIAAPGAETSSRTSNSGGILSLNSGGTLTRIQGTSQATPMVTAAAAMIIGFLKTYNIPYTAAGIESFIKSDGAMINSALGTQVENGRILQLGFLAKNLDEYISSNTNPNFNEEVSTGNLCEL